MDCDILQLAELLKPHKRSGEVVSESESEEEDDQATEDGQETKARKKKTSVYSKIDPPKKAPELQDPDNEDALYFDQEGGEAQDWRKAPSWDVSYKQKVTPSDVFLQIGAKSPATASCEDMIIKVHLPGEDHRNMDLKITKKNIKLVSPKFRLDAPLPHPVNPQVGNAQWDKDTEKLVVTLRMEREFDYVNF